jgi:nucleoside-diphosphate-sugar epimerase
LPGPKFVGMVLSGFKNAVKDVFQVPINVVRFATSMLKPSPGIRISAAEFARAIYEGTAPPVSADEGLRIVALMESACRKADEERAAELATRLSPMRAVPLLVTGAGGFLGRALVRRLRANGSEVRVLVRRPLPWMQQDSGIQVVIGDLGDPEVVAHAVNGVDVVYHVGAAMRGGAREFSAGTVWGTRNVIAACVKWRVKRLVYVSSLSVLDHAGRDPGVAVTETSALEPHPEQRGFYTQSKLEAERLVADAIRNECLPAVIIRPGQIFGPGAEGVTPNGVLAIAGRWIAVGPGSQAIPLVYIDDVVDALTLAAERDNVVSRSFNVVDPRQTRLEEYLSAVGRHAEGAPKVIRVPSSVFLGLAAFVELLGKVLGRAVPLTRYRARSLRPLANFRLDAARYELGWEPRVGVEDGLARTFKAK